MVSSTGPDWEQIMERASGGDRPAREQLIAGLSHGETPAELSYNSGVMSLHLRLKQDIPTHDRSREPAPRQGAFPL